MEISDASLNTWHEEILFFKGDDFFRSLHLAIDSAKFSIDMEFYIFENDNIGKRTIKKLVEAAARGVNVKILVDGVGAAGFARNFSEDLERAGIFWKVYHELPFYSFINNPRKIFERRFFKMFGLINKRNHRKVVVIDSTTAWVGSTNVTDCHTKEFHGEKAWLDISMQVKGLGIKDLILAFNHALKPLRLHSWKELRAWYAREKRYLSPLVRLNVTGSMRRKNYHELLLKIRRARKELFIMTAYFVPKRSLLRALKFAASKGCDVKIIVPKRSDIFFMPWIMSAYYEELLINGIKIYEYIPVMLHAKSLIIDDWAIVGSTNLNHRSIMHDLEVDLVVSRQNNRELLRGEFLKELSNTVKIGEADLKSRGFLQRIFSRVLLIFRDWF